MKGGEKVIAQTKWKNFNKSLKPKDIRCGTCKYNFDSFCVEHSSPVGYGGKVENEFGCELWRASFELFDARLKEIGS